jgi:hypothetical protein
MNRTALIGLLGAGSLGACGKKKSDAAASAPSITKADADAVNAAVPADLKAKVVFDVQTIEDKLGRHTTKYTLVAPTGWKKGFMPGELEPQKTGWPEDKDIYDNQLGRTRIEVGSNCDGACEPKDWAAVVDKVYFSQYTSGKVHGKVLKDVKGKNDRLLVFQEEPTVQESSGSASVTINGQTTTTTMTSTTGNEGITIIHTWWEDGASKHYVCTAELAKPAASLEPAFEKMCGKVSVEH